ncbi:MAG: serine/threonine-protein kinase, partial [Myxococcota bacterium]|nr:serine/threonine-protein kinase [Myxococcota bacterium]
GQLDGVLFMAMEYIDGMSVTALHHQVYQQGLAFPPEHALHLITETLEGLHAAHTLVDTQGRALSLVHRDVSPQNILISKNGEVKVIDFGVAKAASNSSKTRTGAIKGKILYLSPEQLQAVELDARSDLYAAGLILYQLLTGVHPFEGPDEHSTIYNFCTRQLDPPSKLAPQLPEQLDAVVMKALARDREQRFSSAVEMSRALSDVLYSVMPSYRPYKFADFIAWAHDPAAGPAPSLHSGASLSGAVAFAQTAPGAQLSAHTGAGQQPSLHAVEPQSLALSPEPSAKRPLNKDLGEQAKRPLNKDLGEQAKRPLNKDLGEQAKRPLNKKWLFAAATLLALLVLLAMGWGAYVFWSKSRASTASATSAAQKDEKPDAAAQAALEAKALLGNAEPDTGPADPTPPETNPTPPEPVDNPPEPVDNPPEPVDNPPEPVDNPPEPPTPVDTVVEPSPNAPAIIGSPKTLDEAFGAAIEKEVAELDQGLGQLFGELDEGVESIENFELHDMSSGLSLAQLNALPLPPEAEQQWAMALASIPGAAGSRLETFFRIAYYAQYVNAMDFVSHYIAFCEGVAKGPPLTPTEYMIIGESCNAY